jgi:GNAT superfamily N-acetyltransferase
MTNMLKNTSAKVNSSKEALKALDSDIIPIHVAKAKPDDAALLWGLYSGRRISSQANPAIQLTEERMIGAFQDPNSGIFGRLITDMRDAITDDSGKQLVLGAWAHALFNGQPAGIVRPSIDDEGKRWLNNVYVREDAQRLGVFHAMLSEVEAFHEGEPFFLKVADYNEKAQTAYLRTGFEFTGATSQYTIGGILVHQLEMAHPNS